MTVPVFLSEFVDQLPDKPGIYKFYDEKERIIYIGKAKSLKKRVRSYFTGKHENGKIRVLVSKIRKIEHVLVDNEFDAFLLENSLIKKHQPRYNVNLKDGKTYPFICIKNERFPRVFPTRRFIRDGSEYFGPYASGALMHLVLDVVKKLFPVRSCNLNLSDQNIKAGKFNVCLDYHIKICKGPCEGLQSVEDYNNNILNIRQILNGRTGIVIRHLKKEMQKAAVDLQFEKAQDIKEKIEKLETFQARSTVVNPRVHNVDVFSIYSDSQQAFVNYLRVVNGAVIQTYTLEVRKKLNERDVDILMLAIAELKERFKSKSREIIVPFPIETDINIKDKPFKFTYPKAGDKKRLLELSYKNARHYAVSHLHQKVDKKNRHIPVLEELQKVLHLPSLPVHIECFDNSHLQGSQPVSAAVVFKNGEPSKRDYRHFNLNTIDKPDDYAAMEEAVYRRYRRLLTDEAPLPQLLIIDGGKGQLNAALKSLNKLDLQDRIAVRSIAKRLEEIFQPGDPHPLHISKKSSALKLIQYLRNEAHRFSISHHQGRRVKAGIQNVLNEIPGIGKATTKDLLSHFRSQKRLQEAEFEEISTIIGPSRARKVFDYLHDKD